MIPRALLPALLVLLACLAPAPAMGQRAGRETLSRRDLDAAGIHRVSELLFWLGAGSATVEGATWMPALDGAPAGALSGSGLPGWELRVDGQPVEVGLLGAWLPELAPVAAVQIDSVVVERAPGATGGGFASRGVVHVHTRRAPRGPSLRTWVRHGSETGDPGPYIWTPLATPNVDRTGPDATAVAAFAGRGWEVEAAYKRTKHPVTDPRLGEAFGTFQTPFLRTGGPSLRLGVDALGGRHQLLAGRTWQEGALFLPERGRMELARPTLSHLGAAGTVGREQGTRLGYRLSRSVLEAPVFAPEAGGHRRAANRAALELSHRFPALRLAGGVAVEERTLAPTLDGEVEERHAPVTAHAMLERGGDAWTQRITAAVTRSEEAYAPKAAVSAGWRPAPGRALTAAATVARLLPHEGDAWLDARLLRGADQPLPERTVGWAEVGWREELGQGIALEAAGTYNYQDLAAAEGAGARGGRLGARLGLAVRGERLHGRLHYSSWGPAVGTDALEAALASVPAHTLRGWAAYEPFPGFEIGSALLLRSASRWPRLVPPTGAAADPRVGPVARADLSARKRLWSRRIHALLQVQNLFAARERYHPLGADLALRYFVGMGLDLPAVRRPDPSPGHGPLPPAGGL